MQTRSESGEARVAGSNFDSADNALFRISHAATSIWRRWTWAMYDLRWPYIHMIPEEAAAQVAVDLRARALLPAHVGRFTIARHAWNEPFERIRAASHGRPYSLLTPMIGQAVMLDEPAPSFAPWWPASSSPQATAAEEAS